MAIVDISDGSVSLTEVFCSGELFSKNEQRILKFLLEERHWELNKAIKFIMVLRRKNEKNELKNFNC